MLEFRNGFLTIERFQSLSDDSKLLSLSFWRDQAAVTAWRNVARHRQAQRAGRAAGFSWEEQVGPRNFAPCRGIVARAT